MRPPSASKSVVGLLAAATFLGHLQQAAAASFPCDKAATPIERAICSSQEISVLDEYLGRYYTGARLALKHADACLVADQRAWLQTARNPCKDTACLQRAYLQRLATLHALQPGVTSLRSVELPAAQALLWIVPPAGDQVGAPRNLKTRPFAATGRIVNEVAGGDGYVLLAAGGAKHLVMPLMFLEQPTMDALNELSRDPKARVEVRGRTASAAGETPDFSPGQCTFIYRAAP
jgi:uncharacterized protein